MNAKKDSAKAPPQRGDDAIRDANFRHVRRFHRDGMISLADYYKQILDIFKFEPKKNMLKNLKTRQNLTQLQFQTFRMKIMKMKGKLLKPSLLKVF